MTEPARIQVPIPDGEDSEFQVLGMCLYVLDQTMLGKSLDANAKARVVGYLNERFGAPF